ncbi:MAG: hypothetical protein QNJ11_06960 [Woeseiaceae bacterium]|nr:hypothetical protein [Woeseiaceae bacterium]
MESASRLLATAGMMLRYAFVVCVILVPCSRVYAVGTAVGTLVESTAVVDFVQGGSQQQTLSNTVSFAVAERIDVVVTLRSGQVAVSPSSVDQALLFTVTNTGNGSEAFGLALNSIVAGDDFDPVPSVPDSVFFDTDGSGDFNTGDVAYSMGVNDPVLAADESVDVLILNDIPGSVANAEIGRSELSATAATGSGVPGTVYAGQGDGGVDAVIGTTGATTTVSGEYLVDDIDINVVKSQVVSDPNGGNEPIVGATIDYTITVEVVSSGTATAAVIGDPIPTWTTYVPDSITLNGAAISDATDGDSGEYDVAVTPTVVVRLGDLTQADGLQTIAFQVTID